jgi:hypothetical protein
VPTCRRRDVTEDSGKAFFFGEQRLRAMLE